MDACGLDADEQGFGDVWVRVAASDENEDVDFSRSEAERVRPARRLVGGCWLGAGEVEPSSLGEQLELSLEWFGADPGGNCV